ncbi:MAG: AF1514 family protein [Gammaproteobacteria bacterium]|nr:AF1514 family protein [Gammaproteobacteria bacterium]
MTQDPSAPRCPLPSQPDNTGLAVIDISPPQPVDDYREALALADSAAQQHLGDAMLLAWYDRDRDFESPQHASECHQDSAVPGYVDYGLSHGATLKVVIERGRFVFFYMAVEL